MLPNGGSSSQETSECQYSPAMRLEQDLMLRQRLVQFLDLAVAERLSERQARDLGANARRDGRDIDGFVAHRAAFPVRRKIYHISPNRARPTQLK
jgi:hypothetical protein